jgi:hypothetical protein
VYYEDFASHPAMQEQPPGGYRHFALASIKKEKFLGWNNPKTSPKINYFKQNGHITHMHHAETHAIYKVPKAKRSKVRIYIARMSPLGRFANSKPCPGCMFTLLSEGVKLKNIWYTNTEGIWTKMNKLDLGEYYANESCRHFGKKRKKSKRFT